MDGYSSKQMMAVLGFGCVYDRWKRKKGVPFLVAVRFYLAYVCLSVLHDISLILALVRMNERIHESPCLLLYCWVPVYVVCMSHYFLMARSRNRENNEKLKEGSSSTSHLGDTLSTHL